MTLIWTISSFPLSKFIRWGLDEPVSHFAIMFDNKLIFQSNLLGVHPEGIYQFQKSGSILFRIDLKLSLVQEEAVYQNLLKHYEGQAYDYPGFFYFIYRAVLHKLFKVE